MASSSRDYIPFPTSLSFDRLIDFWARHAGDESSPLAIAAERLIGRVSRSPELRGVITDPDVTRRNRDLVDGLVSVLFSPGDPSVLGAVGEPFQFSYVYQTERARKLGVFDREAFLRSLPFDEELLVRGHVVAAYEVILQKAYHRPSAFDYPVVTTVADPRTGLRRHFQLEWDSRFLDVVVRGDLPALTDAQLAALVGEPTNLGLWMDTLPPERFELSGLAVARATDVTMREAISRLKDDLLEQDVMATAARVDRLQNHVRTILGLPDLQVGLIGFDRSNGIDSIDSAFTAGRSLLLRTGVAPECPQRAHSNYAEAFERGEPVVVADMEHGAHRTGFEYHLMEAGLKSLLLQPLFIGDRLIGVLEIASPNAGELTAFAALKLQEVAQPFATALRRSIDERQDRIQSIVKREYTAIHPAVEWRFRDAALRFLSDGRTDEAARAEEIVFRGVYPLYGLTDIRGSSDTRARGIQSDLMEQLGLALAVVREAGKRPSFPVLDQIAFRIEQFVARIEAGLHSEDETAALEFLGREVEPILDELSSWDSDIAERVGAYRESLDQDLGVLYRSRRAFEKSVTRFNEAVSAVIEREQAEAQAVFPHFFERFQTDGVDYNIYVGESIAEKGGFSALYLHNLRLWQLKLVSRVQWELDRVRPQLQVDLAATHLVLVQDQPLAIRFRTAEKRFDVDGAYNIRYELVKKRIDKARIRETGERLTQPGTLAVVYSHAHEAQEYRRYLEYLTAAGYFTGDIEAHELEDMQGVLGLKAFRIAIDREAPEHLRASDSPPDLEEVARIGSG